MNCSPKKQLSSQLIQAQKMEAVGTLAGAASPTTSTINLGVILGYAEIGREDSPEQAGR